MNLLHVGLIVFCAALSVGANGPGPSGNKKAISVGLEQLMAKLEAIENKLQELQNQLNQYRSSQERNEKEIFRSLHKLDQDVAIVLQDRSCHNLTKKSQSTNNYATEDYRPPQTTTLEPTVPDGSSCKAVPLSSEAYRIRVRNDTEPFNVYCEQSAFGGGWIVMQYRFDGRLDFNRGWNEFRDGFGQMYREFWLGLEKVHQITKGRKHELMIELKAFDGSYAYARYDAFEIGSEREGYVLKDLGSYSGTAGNAMTYNKGMKFTTKDRDNDLDTSLQCAQYREGAWWHNACTDANLNGRYMEADDKRAICWAYFKNIFQGLGYSRMMIRELE